MFETGWNLGKVKPQKTTTNDKRNKKRTQEQVAYTEKKKRKLNNISKISKNQEPNQLDKNKPKKYAQSIKDEKLKEHHQIGQNKQMIISKKSKSKNTHSPFADADDFDNSEESAKEVLLNPEKLKNGKLEKMRKKLSEGKFRWINEQLYTITGSKALEMFQENPQLFDEYHDGFRSVVESWPVNPVDLILLYLKQKSEEIIVADLGCGEGKIGLESPNKVLSFDLVAKHDKVIVCDIAKLPIPDSFFDIVIFCLSLMGTNYVEFLKEAYRVLKPSGELKIAEVVSRFSDINKFIEVLAEIGFKLMKKDNSNKMFIMFDFAKKKSNKTKKLQSHHAAELLKPCVYKRR
ncbi:hypothetical protein RhiirA5_423762 [Rhizophagus irregularis]|uniref:Ribosomal RNA-processing protein 8 n=2 Tax=Rhizophagus irregularis TaxID=588596 RepID=A0A2N0R6Z1_9GLOM|nr:hypothetical protein GLOIN_2v1772378 [Rhizophagus irregularis DAOM 181602=DAOM 197198]PKC03439.1 hypothetical protein RhiirA5_423762 [Rhizophagus irregularis]PKC59061.1 hypothetical protein RhiirA1_469993 [Rhizophagus irregularis]POG73506.1 hypothetical protein GLOIN_2v1772378 [Rhizophagus irregularis DAOM 181602=DAOM 197198]UZO19551.1 hypothetical protein OCT59_010836 [Rhizophagus irregularis]CAG8670494.1 14477_t:CDS:2 [Rhizophagus irregularis]|eukprot:XP_025180372.1 hypothetical protein GLOIN_2v1772378 [Rhizophagus irregularis DAOM 181602=DAOM 197198]